MLVTNIRLILLVTVYAGDTSEMLVTDWWHCKTATSMLVTDVINDEMLDEMCWSHFEDVGDGFCHFGRQHFVT